MLCVYSYWAFIDCQTEGDYGNFCRITLTWITVYFLLIEFKQFTFRGIWYFLDLWNYVELFPLICIMISVNLVGAKENNFDFTYTFYIM